MQEEFRPFLGDPDQQLRAAQLLAPGGIFALQSRELALVGARRQLVIDAACQQHPERFVKGPPQVTQIPREVWINHAEDQTAFIG